MEPQLIVALLGILVGLVVALLRLTWMLSSRLSELGARLDDLTRRMEAMDDHGVLLQSLDKRLAVLESEHERMTGPDGPCHMRITAGR